jgi:hypothetical protein
LWGVASLFETGSLIPKTALPLPPDRAVMSRTSPRSWRSMAQVPLVVAPVLLAVAWFADRVDLGARRSRAVGSSFPNGSPDTPRGGC